MFDTFTGDKKQFLNFSLPMLRFYIKHVGLKIKVQIVKYSSSYLI